MTSERSLFVFVLLAVLLTTGCPAPEDPAVDTRAAAPDTLVQEPGRGNARAWCREFVRRRLPESAEATYQEDAKVEDRGGGRYRVQGAVLIRGVEDNPVDRVYDCEVRFDEVDGWILEQLEIRRVRGGDETDGGNGAEVSEWGSGAWVAGSFRTAGSARATRMRAKDHPLPSTYSRSTHSHPSVETW